MGQLGQRLSRVETKHDTETRTLTVRCEEVVGTVTERLSHLERRHDAEIRTLTARCDGPEKGLAAPRATAQPAEQKQPNTPEKKEHRRRRSCKSRRQRTQTSRGPSKRRS